VPPGGHLEAGESSEACARREFLEETEYVCATLHPLDHTHVELEDRRAFDIAFFWCCFDGVQTTVCHEGEALEFVRREDAHAYPIPPFILPIWDRALKESLNSC